MRTAVDQVLFLKYRRRLQPAVKVPLPASLGGCTATQAQYPLVYAPPRICAGAGRVSLESLCWLPRNNHSGQLSPIVASCSQALRTDPPGKLVRNMQSRKSAIALTAGLQIFLCRRQKIWTARWRDARRDNPPALVHHRTRVVFERFRFGDWAPDGR